MRTECVSVRLLEMVQISGKAYRAKDFNGNTGIIPASCVFGRDLDAVKCDAYWIALWLMEKRELTFSYNKRAWFNAQGKMLPQYEQHSPQEIEAVTDNIINVLKK